MSEGHVIYAIFLFPWVLTIVGVAGFWLAGKKVWWAWYVNIANQVLWVTYAVITNQGGFIAGAGFYGFIFIKNAIKWTTEHKAAPPVRRWYYPESTPPCELRGRYECTVCGAEADEWCKDDCATVDPWDYR